MEDFLLYLVGYFSLLLITAMAINGLYITTRGSTEVLPDGSERNVNDMIFYPLLKLLQREKGCYRVYYNGDQLRKLQRRYLKRLALPIPDNIEEEFLQYNNGRSQEAIRAWKEFATDSLDEEEIKLHAEFVMVPETPVIAHARVMFYKEYPVYYISKYIRKPLLECIKCMASIWGTLVYWPVVLGVFTFDWWMFPMWVIFCFSLSFINTYLYNKT